MGILIRKGQTGFALGGNQSSGFDISGFGKSDLTARNNGGFNSFAPTGFNSNFKVDRSRSGTGFGGFGQKQQAFGGFGQEQKGFDVSNMGQSTAGGDTNGVVGTKPRKNPGSAGGMIGMIGGLASGLAMAGQQWAVRNEDKKHGVLGTTSRGVKNVETNRMRHKAQSMIDAAGEGPWYMQAIRGIGQAYKNEFTDEFDTSVKYGKTNFAMQNQQLQNQDLLNAWSIQTAKEGAKLNAQTITKKFTKRDSLIPVFKNGGAINVIPDGKLHKENNSLGEKDKGIPIVTNSGKKVFELEKEELILNADLVRKFESVIKGYNKSEDDSILLSLGRELSNELLTNTKDLSDKYELEAVDES